jgi:hypothetical protein
MQLASSNLPSLFVYCKVEGAGVLLWGGAHGCVRCVGAGAPGLGSRYNLTVVGSSAKKGQSHTLHSFYT